MWGPDDCGPDGYTPDGAPCVPDTNTPPNQTPPPTTGTGTTGQCPQGPGWTWNEAAGTCFPTGFGTPDEGGGGDGYDAPVFGGPRRPNFGYSAPPPFNAPRFTPTTLADVLGDPGYQFGFDEGSRGLQQSAAAKGLLRSGGTLKDLIAWGGNYATQRFDTVNNRRLQAYDRDFRASSAEYAPQYGGWQTQMAMNQRAAELEFQQAFQEWLAQQDWEKYLLGLGAG